MGSVQYLFGSNNWKIALVQNLVLFGENSKIWTDDVSARKSIEF